MKFYPLAVRGVIDETDSARSFVLEPVGEALDLFGYRAGQFLTLRVPWGDGGFLDRCYSLSSAPETGARMKVTVKRVEGGRVSNWLNDNLKAGDTIESAPPGGRFTLRHRDRPLVFHAGGSGITPVISLVKSALGGKTGPMGLHYANRDRDSIIFRREIRDLCRRHPDRLRCHHHLDAESGRPTPDTVKAFIEAYGGADHYVCGPGPLMDLTEEALADAGIAGERVFIERFTLAGDPDAGDRGDVAAVVAPPGVTGFRATLDGTLHEVVYRAGETLLDCMLSAGLDPAFSCRDARCGSCMAVRKAGDVAMRKNKVLSRRDLDGNRVLLCQSVPMSDDVWVDCDE